MTTTDPPDPPDLAAASAAIKTLGDWFVRTGHVMTAQAALGAAMRGDVNAARVTLARLPAQVRDDVAEAATVLLTILTGGDPLPGDA